jgi:uncharacterized protein involved in exopolysaccharide biosynthesis
LSTLHEAADLDSGYPQPPLDENGRGKAKTLWILWQNRGFLWRVFWLTAIASIVVAYLLPVHYEGVAKIVPGESSGNFAAGLVNRATGGANTPGFGGLDPSTLLGLKTPAAFYIEILKSRTVQDRMIDRFDLRSRYRLTRWSSPTTYYSARKKLKSFSDFEEDKKSGVIIITVTDYDARAAAEMANAYVEELNRLAAALNTSAAHREREFLEERLKSAKEDLDKASLELSRFSSTSYIMDPQTQQRSLMDAASKIEGDLIASETELRGLQQLYSDDNVRVRTLKARMGELQSQLRKLQGGGASSASKPGDAPYPSLRALPGLNYRYLDLYRQTRTQEAVYDFLTQQYELAKLQEVKELPTVRVMDRAVPPERKSGPIRSLIVLLSVFLGLALASFWVIEKYRWQQLPADDPRRLLAEDVSGVMRKTFGRFKGRR